MAASSATGSSRRIASFTSKRSSGTDIDGDDSWDPARDRFRQSGPAEQSLLGQAAGSELLTRRLPKSLSDDRGLTRDPATKANSPFLKDAAAGSFEKWLLNQPGCKQVRHLVAPTTCSSSRSSHLVLLTSPRGGCISRLPQRSQSESDRPGPSERGHSSSASNAEHPGVSPGERNSASGVGGCGANLNVLKPSHAQQAERSPPFSDLGRAHTYLGLLSQRL